MTKKGNSITVHLIAAARPNFMKIAPLYHELSKHDWCVPVLVHTGQHYDSNMSDSFFQDLALPTPDIHLGVGSGTHAQQTGGVMIAYEGICAESPPDWIVVVGDVNSTMACALVGAKLNISVAHLEAGLRSRDRTMPEEINRLVTDAVADLLWTPSPDADENLLSEGIPRDKIEQVGNIMIDSFELLAPRIREAGMARKLGLNASGYGVVTLHRPSNVDERAALGLIVEKLLRIADLVPLVFPIHPRTRERLERFGLMSSLEDSGRCRTLDPIGYIDFMSLIIDSRFALTDSGGIQEETSYLGIPCLTLRDNTERPVTIELGTNRLVRAATVDVEVRRLLENEPGPRPVIPLWDGSAAARVAESLKKHSA